MRLVAIQVLQDKNIVNLQLHFFCPNKVLRFSQTCVCRVTRHGHTLLWPSPLCLQETRTWTWQETHLSSWLALCWLIVRARVMSSINSSPFQCFPYKFYILPEHTDYLLILSAAQPTKWLSDSMDQKVLSLPDLSIDSTVDSNDHLLCF